MYLQSSNVDSATGITVFISTAAKYQDLQIRLIKACNYFIIQIVLTRHQN